MREFLQQAAKEVFKDEDIWQKYVRSGETNFLRKEFLVAIALYKIAWTYMSCIYRGWYHNMSNTNDFEKVYKFFYDLSP